MRSLNPVSPQDREELLELDTTGNDRLWLPTVDEVAAAEDQAREDAERYTNEAD